MGGGAPESSVRATKGALVPPCSVSNKMLFLVTRVGGWGEAWGGGPWRAGKGGDGGGTREQCGSNKGALVPPFRFKNLTTGLIWLVGWGEAWGGGPWRAGKGGDGGGGTREQCGEQ